MMSQAEQKNHHEHHDSMIPPSKARSAPLYITSLLTLSVLLLLTLTAILVAPLNRFIPGVMDHVCRPPQDSSKPLYHQLSDAEERRFIRQFQYQDWLEKTELETPAQPRWEDLIMPPHGNGGFQSTDKDFKGNNLLYGLSMFHQLHCLTMIRSIIFTDTSMREENSTLNTFNGGGPAEDHAHWAHCFDYVMQALLCHADDTIEPPMPITINGKETHDADIENTKHRCKDARSLYQYVEQSFFDPIDMSDWTIGQGARSYMGPRLEKKPKDIPKVYSDQMQMPMGDVI